jgi:flagellar basal-body rod modification protein FlgD
MISTKVGTQDFSKATQRHDFGDQGTGQAHYAPATPDAPKAEKGLHTKSAGGPGTNEKNVGEYLNEVANPGGDPNKTKRKAHNTLDKDDFLKLMLTQMKNQDPMNPMQSHEMAAQLAQFTSLEQLFNVNKNLEGLGKAQDPLQKYEALNFLGKTIKADSRQILRQTGDQGTELRFNLANDATKIKLTIADESGEVVKTIDFGNLKKGSNKIVWNGTDKEDRDVKPGKYTFNVEAENGGNKVGVITETKGTITGVNYTPEGPMLMVGDQRVRLQDVQKIEDEGLREKQLATEAPAAQQLAPEVTEGAKPSVGAAEKVKVKPETKEQAEGGTKMAVTANGGQINTHPNFQKL